MRLLFAMVVAVCLAGCASQCRPCGPDGFYRQPAGVFPVGASDVKGAPDGWVYVRTVRGDGVWVERHGYGKTKAEAFANAGGNN